MRLTLSVALLSAAVVTMLGGCEANQLYMGSKTVVGINAAVNPEQTKGWLVVGYERNFAAVIPRSVEDPATGKQEAMSSIACSRLEVKGITIKHYTESIATGDAAIKFAEGLQSSDPRVVKDFFNCFKDKPAAKPVQTGGAVP
jgi:hypothetical protein